jgi:hypothetical protein
MGELAQDLIEAGELDGGERERLVNTAHEAARKGRFEMSADERLLRWRLR